MKLSLVIPCFNEEKNIPLVIDRCKEILKEEPAEIVVVDNGSSDKSLAILKKLTNGIPNFKIIRLEANIGYGGGILKGLEATNGDVLAWTHADMQTDPKDVLIGYKFFKASESNVFIKGTRQGRPITESIFTVAMSIFETLLLKRFMWDINAQPTMFTRKFLDDWKEAPTDFSLDLFAYYQAIAKKFKIIRFPVVFSKRAYGVSNWNINWKSKFKFIKRTISYSLKIRKII